MDTGRRARRRLTTLRATLREHGVAGAGYLILQRMALPGLRVEWFVMFDHCRDMASLAPAFRWAGPEEADRLGAFQHGAAGVSARLARGERCAIVEDEGRIVAWVWIVPQGSYDEAGLIVHLGPGEVWAYDALVAPGHRGRRLSPGLKHAVARDLAGEGVWRIVSTVDRLNTASLRAASRSGQPVARFVQLQAGARGVVRIATDGAARWHRYRGHLDLRVPARH